MQLAVGYDLTGLMLIAHGGPASDLLDGFFIDDSVTHITTSGTIGLEADAYLASIQGDLSVGLTMSPAPNGPGDRTYLYKLPGESIDQILKFSADITLSFTVSVGIELGPIQATLFSFTIGPFTLAQFGTAYSAPSIQLDTSPTIAITETNSESGSVVVHQATIPDPNTANQNDVVIEVDYPDGTQDYYPVEALNATTNNPITRPSSWPTNYQIVTETNGLASFPMMDPTVITQGQTIIVNSDVVNYNANNQQEPVNAVLIGGEGNDELEYDASGNAAFDRQRRQQHSARRRQGHRLRVRRYHRSEPARSPPQ